MTDHVNKLRGGYYTPENVARFICEWAIQSKNSTVLEPSCGDGAFVDAAIHRLTSLGASSPSDQVTGVELYKEEATKAAAKGGNIICGDFFTLCQESLGRRKFDAIVGNPPFIRYQEFDEEFRSAAFDLMREYGFSPNRLTNIWLPFLVICCHLLSDTGRLGMVIPAELFQVKYAAETRKYLTREFATVSIVTFSELLFDGAQQEVILLLLERTTRGEVRGVRVIEEANDRSLATLIPSELEFEPIKQPLPDSMKWQAYYLDEPVLNLLEELRSHGDVHIASELFDVNVGVVSGQNSFFVIDQETAVKNGIIDSCAPIISRSFQLNGLTLTDEDFDEQLRRQSKILLFLPNDKLSSEDLSYIKGGEAKGYNNNFKCRIRTPWYKIPISWKPDAFFYRQVGSCPRIVLNEKAAHTTDTLHKVRFAKGIDGKSLAVAFNNSLTFLMGELMGRSYGGGVLTFEPSEARNLPVPFVSNIDLDFERADYLVRQNRVDDLVDYVDSLLLGSALGISQSEIERLNSSWKALRDRRLARKKR